MTTPKTDQSPVDSPSAGTACSAARLLAVANNCRVRGGSCGCVGLCKALALAEHRLTELFRQRSEIQKQIDATENLQRKVRAKPASLREGFRFREGLEPVIVFDGGEATFGYEDSSGGWIESGEWPFAETYVWPDDCERLGIRVE